MGTAGSKEQQEVVKDLLSLFINFESSTSWQNLSSSVQSSITQNLVLFLRVFPESPTTGPILSWEGKGKRIANCIHILLQWHSSCIEVSDDNKEIELLSLEDPLFPKIENMELLLKCWRRCISWKQCYKAITSYSLHPILLSLQSSSPTVKMQALDIIWSMIQSRDNEKLELCVKTFLGSNQTFECVASLWDKRNASAISTELTSTLKIFQSLLVTRVHTTETSLFEKALALVMSSRKHLLDLCSHPARCVATLANDFIRSLFLETFKSLEQVSLFQDSARESGAILKVFNSALNEAKLLDPSDISRNIDLFEMLCIGNPKTEALMYRILPLNLLVSQWKKDSDSIINVKSKSLTSATSASFSRGSSYFFKRSASVNEFSFSNWLQSVRQKGQRWLEVPHAAVRVHSGPRLIWHNDMLYELQDILTHEIHSIKDGKNWEGEAYFNVDYSSSLKKELCVYGYFITPLLQRLENEDDIIMVENPTVLCWHLQDRLVVEDNVNQVVVLIKTIKYLIRRYAIELNSVLPFEFIVQQIGRRRQRIQDDTSLEHYIDLAYTAIIYGSQEGFIKCDGIEPLLSLISNTSSTTAVTHKGLQLLAEVLKRAPYVLRKESSLLLRGETFLTLTRGVLFRYGKSPPSEASVERLELLLNVVGTVLDAASSNSSITLDSRFFALIMWIVSSSEYVMTENVATLIAKFTALNDNNIALRHLLPHGMVQLLVEEKIENFVRVWNSKDLLEQPFADVRWTVAMQSHLYKSAGDILQDDDQEVTKIEFGLCHPDELYVGNIYVTAFASSNKLLLAWDAADDWENVLQALENKVVSTNTSNSDNLVHDAVRCETVLLQAIYTLLRKHDFLSLNAKTHTRLISLLKSSNDLYSKKSQARLCVAIELLLITSPSFIGPESLVALGTTLENMSTTDFWQSVDLRFETIEAVDVILLLCKFVLAHRNVVDLASTKYGVVESILAYCRHNNDSINFPVVACTALNTLMALVETNEAIRKRVISCGGLLETTLICVCKKWSSSVRVCAAKVLQAFVVKNNCNMVATKVLEQLLSPGVVSLLKSSPEKVVDLFPVVKDIKSPVIVFSVSMQQRLERRLVLEIQKARKGEWDASAFIAAESFRYEYPELKSVLLITNVFIDQFNLSEGREEDGILIEEFSKELVAKLQSTEKVLDILRQNPTNQPQCIATQVKTLHKVRQALNWLTTRHPELNIAGIPTKLDRQSPEPEVEQQVASLCEDDNSSDDDYIV